MSRHRTATSYGHCIEKLYQADCYRISWTVDCYVEGSRLRFPRVSRRLTDLAGAKRFARRHKLAEPV